MGRQTTRKTDQREASTAEAETELRPLYPLTHCPSLLETPSLPHCFTSLLPPLPAPIRTSTLPHPFLTSTQSSSFVLNILRFEAAVAQQSSSPRHIVLIACETIRRVTY